MSRNTRQPKISEVIAMDLARRILRDGLEPGEMLPIEKDLISEFAVGRSTIREALRLLESRGVVTVKPGPRGGPVVKHPDSHDMARALQILLEFKGASTRDLLEARYAIEPNIARLAAEHMSGDSLKQELSASIKRMRENIDRQDSFLEENQTFHGLMSSTAGNPVLSIINEALQLLAFDLARADPVGNLYTLERRNQICEDHTLILEALTSGSPDDVESAMRDHLLNAHEYWHSWHAEMLDEPVQWMR